MDYSHSAFFEFTIISIIIIRKHNCNKILPIWENWKEGVSYQKKL